MRLNTKESQGYRDKLEISSWEAGKKQADIASLYGYSQSTISRILSLYRKNNKQLPPTRDIKNRGPKCRMDETKDCDLNTILSKGALAEGYHTDSWDRRRVMQVIQKKFGITYSLTHVSVVLHRINYTLQKPIRKDYRQDPIRKEEWKTQELPDLKKSGV